MKEHPILFNGTMVRALLAGQKMQTRRIVKSQPDIVVSGVIGAGGICARFTPDDERLGRLGEVIACPYGQPGDRLWVREAFAYSVIDPEGLSPEDDPENYDIIYRATDQPAGGWSDGEGSLIKAPWKPSIHMPRWASRIDLEIVSVRVERLQDISEADALSEGVSFNFPVKPSRAERMGRDAFCALWESINGSGSWEANPWLWVVEFRRLP